MALEHFEVILDHFQGRDIGVLHGDEFEFNLLPEGDDRVDLFLHLGLVSGNFSDLFNGVFVVEDSQVP